MPHEIHTHKIQLSKAKNLYEPDIMVPVPGLDDDRMAMADHDATPNGLLASNIPPEMSNDAVDSPLLNAPLALAAIIA